MQLTIDSAEAVANSRLTAIRLALLTSRCMENWRRVFGDGDKTMILLAVLAIGGERLTRTPLPEDLKTLQTPLPPDLLKECNVSSIAAATGLNRETTRRKVNAMVKEGVLSRSEDGEIRFLPSGIAGQDEALELVRKQLEAITRFANESLRDGVLKAA
jgi:hypothetical protein